VVIDLSVPKVDCHDGFAKNCQLPGSTGLSAELEAAVLCRMGADFAFLVLLYIQSEPDTVLNIDR
jgi:hypothetical protein